MAVCGKHGFIAEFYLSLEDQSRVFPQMFNGRDANTIAHIEESDFAVATSNGLHIFDMDSGNEKANYLSGLKIYAITYLGNGHVLTGAGREYHIVDVKDGVTRKVAVADS